MLPVRLKEHGDTVQLHCNFELYVNTCKFYPVYGFSLILNKICFLKVRSSLPPFVVIN